MAESYYKSPYTNRRFFSPMENTKTPLKTSITQRLRTNGLRTVILGNNRLQSGVIKPVYGLLIFPLTTKAV